MSRPTIEPQDDPVLVLEAHESPDELPPPADSPEEIASPPRRRTAVIVLSALLVVFLSTAGAFGVLYSGQKQENSRLTGQIAQRDADLAESARRIQRAEDDTLRAKSFATTAEDARRRAKEDADKASQCREASKQVLAAADVGDETKGIAAIREMRGSC